MVIQAGIRIQAFWLQSSYPTGWKQSTILTGTQPNNDNLQMTPSPPFAPDTQKISKKHSQVLQVNSKMLDVFMCPLFWGIHILFLKSLPLVTPIKASCNLLERSNAQRRVCSELENCCCSGSPGGGELGMEGCTWAQHGRPRCWEWMGKCGQ